MARATFMMMRLGTLAVILATTGATAVAKPSDKFTKEFQAGVDAYRLGKLDDARGHLEKAKKLEPKLPGSYRFLAAVAQAQQRWEECIDNAHEALHLNPASAEAPETKKLYDGCRASAGRMPYRGPDLGESAAIAVNTSVPGATVRINKLSYGGTPLAPRRISAGALEVEITKAGYKPVHITVEALAGIVNDVVVELEAAR